MEAFINFAYTGQITLTEDNAQSLIRDADYLGLNDVKDACAHFLKSHVHFWNVIEVNYLAELLNCTSLEKTCIQFINTYFQEVSQTDGYLELDFNLLEHTLARKNIHVDSQKNLFDALVRWITHDVEGRKIHLQDLLKFVKFSDLNRDYLTNYFFQEAMAIVTDRHL